MMAAASRERKALIVTNVLVACIGSVLLILYRIGLHARGVTDIVWFIKLALVQSALYLIVVWLIGRASSARSTLILVLLFAGIFRLSIIFAPPYLSDDIYRYVWDGRVQAAGINPYLPMSIFKACETKRFILRSIGAITRTRYTLPPPRRCIS
jgi:hypothetical protein